MTSLFGLDGDHDTIAGTPHPDEGCYPCIRPDCGHWQCQHADDPGTLNGLGECDRDGCDCTAALVDDDCPGEQEFDRFYQCNGIGRFYVPNDRTGEIDEWVCTLCNGTGQYVPKVHAS